MAIVVNLDVMLAKRKMPLTELSQKVGITMSNLSILKSNKANEVRFYTCDRIRKVINRQPSDILEYQED
jgi:putative transcriptional regulator